MPDQSKMSMRSCCCHKQLQWSTVFTKTSPMRLGLESRRTKSLLLHPRSYSNLAQNKLKRLTQSPESVATRTHTTSPIASFARATRRFLTSFTPSRVTAPATTAPSQLVAPLLLSMMLMPRQENGWMPQSTRLPMALEPTRLPSYGQRPPTLALPMRWMLSVCSLVTDLVLACMSARLSRA